MKRILVGIACLFWSLSASWAEDFSIRPSELTEKYNMYVRAYGWSSPVTLDECTKEGACTYWLSSTIAIGLMPSREGGVDRGLVFYSAEGPPDDEGFLDAIAILSLVLSDGQEALNDMPSSLRRLFPPSGTHARTEIVIGDLRLARETLIERPGFLVTITRP